MSSPHVVPQVTWKYWLSKCAFNHVACGGDSEVTHRIPEVSVWDNIFKSSFRQIIIAFFWGENPSTLRQGNCNIYSALLESWTHRDRWWTLTPSFYQCRNGGPERLGDMHKVTQQGKCKVSTDSTRASPITLYIPSPGKSRINKWLHWRARVKAEVSWNLCAYRVSYTDLHFDPSVSSKKKNLLSNKTHCPSKWMRSSQGLLLDALCCPYKLEPGVREFHPPQEASLAQRLHCSPLSHCLLSCLCCKMLGIYFVLLALLWSV